jgi:hypothetical protein
MRKSNKAFLLLGSVFVLMFSIVYSLQGLGGVVMRTPESTTDHQVYIAVILNPPHTMTAISNIADGEVMNRNCTNWETCRNAQSSNTSLQGLVVGTVGASLTSEYAYVVQRTFYFFDTTTIPIGAEITEATLYLYVSDWKNGNNIVHVVRSTADTPLDTDDFSEFENVSGGSTNPSSTYSWMSIDLDEAALNWIVGGDTTKLALIHDYDLNNITPVARNDLLVAMSEDSENRPYLEFTYAVP